MTASGDVLFTVNGFQATIFPPGFSSVLHASPTNRLIDRTSLLDYCNFVKLQLHSLAFGTEPLITQL